MHSSCFRRKRAHYKKPEVMHWAELGIKGCALKFRVADGALQEAKGAV